MIMKTFENVKQLPTQSKKTVLIFTRGLHLSIAPDGNGSSGNWVIRPQRLDRCEKVVIYLRNTLSGKNEIYIGAFVDYHDSDHDKRLVIDFRGLKLVGITTKNWLEFAGIGQSPIGVIE